MDAISTSPKPPRSPRGARVQVARAAAAALLALLLALACGAQLATAKTVHGGAAAEKLTGTAQADKIFGAGGDDSLLGKGSGDTLNGGPGNDTLTGGPGHDVILGGAGDDRIVAADGAADRVDCGPGHDVAIVDQFDQVSGCEVVERPGEGAAPAANPAPAPSQSSAPSAAATPSAPTGASSGAAAPAGGETAAPKNEAGHEGEAGEKGSAEEPAAEEPEEEPAAEEPEEEPAADAPIPTYEENPIATFPAGHGWTGNGVGNFEDAGEPFVVNNDRSFKVETDGEGDESIATSPTLPVSDLRGSHVAVQGLISYSDYLGEVRLRLSSGDIEDDYAEAVVWHEGDDPTILGGSFELQSIALGDFTVHGDVDWSQIDQAQLIVTDNHLGKVLAYFAGIYAVPTQQRATVSFAFDDGLASTYELGLKKLSAYRFPATAYVIADAIDTPGFMSEEDLYTLRNLDHWEIGGHAMHIDDHNAHNGLDGLSPTELKADFDEMRSWMFERGFAQRTFAYPQGAASPEVRKYAERDYCAARVTAKGPETVPPRNQFAIRGFSIDGTTTHVEQLEAEVDKAIAQKSWLVLTFHKLVTGTAVEATDFNYGEFGEIVDYVQARLAEKKLKVRTVADAVGC